MLRVLDAGTVRNYKRRYLLLTHVMYVRTSVLLQKPLQADSEILTEMTWSRLRGWYLGFFLIRFAQSSPEPPAHSMPPQNVNLGRGETVE